MSVPRSDFRSQEMRLRTIMSVTAVLAASWVLASDADAKTHADTTAGNLFEGTCQLTGDIHFATPLGEQLRPTTFTGTGAGTCTGSLNGGPSADHPTYNEISGLGSLSCAAGHTLTDDLLTFANGPEIRSLPTLLSARHRASVTSWAQSRVTAWWRSTCCRTSTSRWQRRVRPGR
jgi:hypothetical protein